MHKVMEYGEGDNQAIRHNGVLKVASRGHKCCLPLVPLMYLDEVGCSAEVQHGEDLHTSEMF